MHKRLVGAIGNWADSDQAVRPEKNRSDLTIVKSPAPPMSYAKRMKRALARLLILLLLLPSFGFAASVAGRSTPMVICGATGARTVWMDASGVPSEAPQDCDDCALCLSSGPGLLLDALALPLSSHGAMALRLQSVQGPPPAAHRIAPQPRGPPHAKGDRNVPSAQLVRARPDTPSGRPS